MSTRTEKHLIVTITSEGETKVEAFGYTDGKCRDATRDFENDLGTWTHRDVKSEACLEAEQQEKVRS